MPRSHLSYRQICTFWLPLAGTWLMMAVEAPYLAAIVARLEQAHADWATGLADAPILPAVRSTLVDIHGDTVQLFF